MSLLSEEKAKFWTMLEKSWPSLLNGVDQDDHQLTVIRTIAKNANYPKMIDGGDMIMDTLTELGTWIRENIPEEVPCSTPSQ